MSANFLIIISMIFFMNHELFRRWSQPYVPFSCVYLLKSFFFHHLFYFDISQDSITPSYVLGQFFFSFRFYSLTFHWTKPWIYLLNTFLPFLFRWMALMFIKRQFSLIFPNHLRSRQINCFWFFFGHSFSLHDEFIFIWNMIYV